MSVIDAHHHLWDLSGGIPGWLSTPETEPIARPFGLPELAEVTEAAGVDATVLVQTVAEPEETRRFLRLAAESDRIAAVTGWADITADDLDAVLDEYAAAAGGHLLRAIRYGVQDDPGPDALADPRLIAGAARLGSRGLGMEFLVRPRHLAAAASCAEAAPGTAFVLDHAGKPDIARGAFDDWAARIDRLAALPNVSCKLSGLVTEASPDWSPDDLRRYTDHLLDRFGPSRLMFGSDWPVCLLASEYVRWYDTARELTADLSEEEQVMVFGGSATVFYRLDRP